MLTKTLSILYYPDRSDPQSASDRVEHVSLKLSDFVFSGPLRKAVCDCRNCRVERQMQNNAIAKGHPFYNLEAMKCIKKRLEKNKDKYNPFVFRFNEQVIKFAIAVCEKECKERFEWVLEKCVKSVQSRKEMEKMQHLSKASAIQPNKAGKERRRSSPVSKVQPSPAGKKRRSPLRNVKSVYNIQQKTSLVDKDTIRIDMC